MRDDFKKINGREVTTIGYDREKKILLIEYNMFREKSHKTVYYEDVEAELFDKLLHSDSTAIDAETLLKDKKQHF